MASSDPGLLETGALVGGWGRVVDLFSAVAKSRPGTGAALCVYHRGECVVDIWTRQAYASDSLQVVWSSTKGVIAACLAVLADRGELDVGARVARYWPDFAHGAKRDLAVWELLSHRAGVPALDSALTPEQWAGPAAEAAVCDQEPYWRPGDGHGYHAVTWGVLAQCLIRNVTGTSAGEFLRAEVAVPCGIDFWVGLPQALESRVVPLIPPKSSVRHAESENAVQAAVWASAPFLADERFINDPAIHQLELPALNGIGSARGMARLYSLLLTDTAGLPRLVRSSTLSTFVQEGSRGTDLASGDFTRFGLGFQLPTPENPMGHYASFGHAGRGGSIAFGNAALGLAFAYASDYMSPVAGRDAALEPVAAAAALTASQI